MSVFMMVVLIFTTTPTEVQAQTYNPVFYYYIGDHLGSSNVMTDRNGVLVEHYEYTAFGFAKCSSGSAFQVSNRYTGQELDDETGLYYYGSRYYDPALGRFTQPDTMVPDPGDSQQLNRYSYVNNNPLKYTDPSGHELAAATIIIIGVVVGAAVGGATAAATGGNVGMGILTGAIGGLFGGVGAWAGGAIGASASGLTGAAAAASSAATTGAFIGAVAGGAAGGAVSAAVTGGNVGMGALTGAIAGAIGFGVGQLGFSDPGSFGEYLANAGLSTAGGAGGGAVGAALQGGDPLLGAAYGAAGAAGGYVLAQSLVTYFDEQAELLWPGYPGAGRPSDHTRLSTNGILGNRADAQAAATANGSIHLFNPSQGLINDVLQTFWQKVFFGFGDSLARQFTAASSQMPRGSLFYGHSQGAVTAANAGLRGGLPGGARVHLAGPATSWLRARASISGTLTYRMNWGDSAAIWAPSLFKAAAGIGPWGLRQHRNYRMPPP